MSKLPMMDMAGKKLGEFDLSDDLLLFDKGGQAVHDAIVAIRANRRAGTASTLTKGEVAGSNKKPWKQKGTGNARAGYKQSPIWRGGGVAFGPRPRDFGKKVNKKASRMAFKRALSERVAAGDVIVIDALAFEKPATKAFAGIMKKLDAPKGALFVLESMDSNVTLSARNIPKVAMTTARELNTYQVLRYPRLFVTKGAMADLEQRLQKSAGRAS